MVWRIAYLKAIAKQDNLDKFKFKVALLNKINMDEDQLIFADHTGKIITDLEEYEHLERVSKVPKLLDPELEAGQKIHEHMQYFRSRTFEESENSEEDIMKMIHEFPSVMKFLPTDELMCQLIRNAARLKDETDIKLMVNPEERNNDAQIRPLSVGYES